jgi:hypothetical protein
MSALIFMAVWVAFWFAAAALVSARNGWYYLVFLFCFFAWLFLRERK